MGFLSDLTDFLHRRLCWRCVLFADQLEFFSILIGTCVLHATQFVQLLEREFGFTQLTQLRLCVVLGNILVACGRTFINFVQNHDVFIILWVWPLVPAHLVWYRLRHLQVRLVRLLLLLVPVSWPFLHQWQCQFPYQPV